MKSIDHLTQLPKAAVFLLAWAMIGVVGAIDYTTGPQLGCSVFQLVPIFLVSWMLGRVPALATAALAAAVWLFADLADAQRYLHSWMPFWNASVRLIFFTVFVLLIVKLNGQRTLARQDALTGVANRLGFREAAEREIERSRRYERPLSIVFLDCDNFKFVNDHLGHQTGDALLFRLAAFLRSHCRGSDTVARLGGDEFAILLPETDANGAQAVVQKLQDACDFTRDLPGVAVTFSAGVATFLAPPPSIEDIMRTADDCMYEAKGSARGGLKQAVVPAGSRRPTYESLSARAR